MTMENVDYQKVAACFGLEDTEFQLVFSDRLLAESNTGGQHNILSFKPDFPFEYHVADWAYTDPTRTFVETVYRLLHEAPNRNNGFLYANCGNARVHSSGRFGIQSEKEALQGKLQWFAQMPYIERIVSLLESPPVQLYRDLPRGMLNEDLRLRPTHKSDLIHRLKKDINELFKKT